MGMGCTEDGICYSFRHPHRHLRFLGTHFGNHWFKCCEFTLTSIFRFDENTFCIFLPKSLKIIFQLGVCPSYLYWYFTRGCVSLQCVFIMYKNIWLFLSRLKSVKWWPLRKNPCGLSLNVPILQLYQMRQLELFLNMAMICAKTCLFYRYASVKDFFSYLKKYF